MYLASLVWRAMLSPSGNFKETHPKNGEVSFPENDPDAMLTAFSAGSGFLKETLTPALKPKVYPYS